MKNYEYKTPPGDSIFRAAKMVEELTAIHRNVDLIFNDMLIVVTDEDSQEEIVSKWALETNIFNKEDG